MAAVRVGLPVWRHGDPAVGARLQLSSREGGGCGLSSGSDARGGRRVRCGCPRRGGPHAFWLMRRVPAVSARCQGSPQRGPQVLPAFLGAGALLPPGNPRPPPGSPPPRDQRPAVGGTAAPLLGKGVSPAALRGPLLPPDACSCWAPWMPQPQPPSPAGTVSCWASQDPGPAVSPASRRCSEVLAGHRAAVLMQGGTRHNRLFFTVRASPRFARHESIPNGWFCVRLSGSRGSARCQDGLGSRVGPHGLCNRHVPLSQWDTLQARVLLSREREDRHGPQWLMGATVGTVTLSWALEGDPCPCPSPSGGARVLAHGLSPPSRSAMLCVSDLCPGHSPWALPSLPRSGTLVIPWAPSRSLLPPAHDTARAQAPGNTTWTSLGETLVLPRVAP